MPWPLGPDDDNPDSGESTENKTLKTWTLYAKYKKSTVEREHYTKDGQTIIVETGWRGGDFTVNTVGDDPPDIDVENEDGIDVYGHSSDNVDSIDTNSTYDGCWMDIEWPEDMPEEEQERLQELIDENGFYDALTEEGWDQTDGEMWLHGPLVIEDSDGNVVADGEPDSDKQQW